MYPTASAELHAGSRLRRSITTPCWDIISESFALHKNHARCHASRRSTDDPLAVGSPYHQHALSAIFARLQYHTIHIISCSSSPISRTHSPPSPALSHEEASIHQSQHTMRSFPTAADVSPREIRHRQSPVDDDV
jgi:hypothetical protein